MKSRWNKNGARVANIMINLMTLSSFGLPETCKLNVVQGLSLSVTTATTAEGVLKVFKQKFSSFYRAFFFELFFLQKNLFFMLTCLMRSLPSNLFQFVTVY